MKLKGFKVQILQKMLVSIHTKSEEKDCRSVKYLVDLMVKMLGQISSYQVLFL